MTRKTKKKSPIKPEPIRIDLKAPTNWQEVTTEQLRFIVDLVNKGLSREEYLLVLLCEFTGIKMVSGTSKQNATSTGSGTVKATFKTAEGQSFTLEDWQVSDFCERLSFVFDETMPIETAWPFKWDRYLMDTTFGDWFHADAQMLGLTLDGDFERLKGAMKDLGDPHEDLQPLDADVVLMLKWYDCFKDWLQERYPLVFQKVEPGMDPTTPLESRKNIMLMLNDGHPNINEAIEMSNVHDVLAAIQHRIEYAKQMEEQIRKYNR